MIASRLTEQSVPTYTDESVAKLFSENRERYIAQSLATKNGVVAPLPEVKVGDGS